MASDLINTSEQMGGAIGLAVLASVAALRTNTLESAGTSTAEALIAGFSLVFLGAGAIKVLTALTVTATNIRKERA